MTETGCNYLIIGLLAFFNCSHAPPEKCKELEKSSLLEEVRKTTMNVEKICISGTQYKRISDIEACFPKLMFLKNFKRDIVIARTHRDSKGEHYHKLEYREISECIEKFGKYGALLLVCLCDDRKDECKFSLSDVCSIVRQPLLFKEHGSVNNVKVYGLCVGCRDELCDSEDRVACHVYGSP